MHTFLESWLLKICQHTAAQQPSHTQSNSYIPSSKKAEIANIYQHPPTLTRDLFLRLPPFRVWTLVYIYSCFPSLSFCLTFQSISSDLSHTSSTDFFIYALRYLTSKTFFFLIILFMAFSSLVDSITSLDSLKIFMIECWIFFLECLPPHLVSFCHIAFIFLFVHLFYFVLSLSFLVDALLGSLRIFAVSTWGISKRTSLLDEMADSQTRAEKVVRWVQNIPLCKKGPESPSYDGHKGQQKGAPGG